MEEDVYLILKEMVEKSLNEVLKIHNEDISVVHTVLQIKKMINKIENGQ